VTFSKSKMAAKMAAMDIIILHNVRSKHNIIINNDIGVDYYVFSGKEFDYNVNLISIWLSFLWKKKSKIAAK